jgi:hypothetical protein
MTGSLVNDNRSDPPPLSATCLAALAAALENRLCITCITRLIDDLAAALHRYQRATRLPRRAMIETLQRVAQRSRALRRDLPTLMDLGQQLQFMLSLEFGIDPDVMLGELSRDLEFLEKNCFVAELLHEEDKQGRGNPHRERREFRREVFLALDAHTIPITGYARGPAAQVVAIMLAEADRHDGRTHSPSAGRVDNIPRWRWQQWVTDYKQDLEAKALLVEHLEIDADLARLKIKT